MKKHMITDQSLVEFGEYLREEEFGKATMEKYLREVRSFFKWLGGRDVDKQVTAEFKNSLQEKGYAPSTVNGKLADMLGHSSVETTRIYLRTSGKEHLRYLESTGLLM